MPRKAITSLTKKKAKVKLDRAIKRGEVERPPKTRPSKHKHRRRPPGASDVAVESARKLQSKFNTLRLPPEFLEMTKDLSAKLPLPRPIPFTPMPVYESDLSCPVRPKWKYTMSKTEVEKNEEGVFRKWLTQTDDAVEQWQNQTAYHRDLTESADEPPPPPPEPTTMPRSTTIFERNIEVWRQLWRVTEISQLLLVLLDSRAPLLHFPPSLQDYLSDKRVILVLTKVDISGPERAEAWTRYLNVHYPGYRVVQVESYVEKEVGALHQGQRHHQPHIPEEFRRRLVDAIREEHAALLEPPENVKSNPKKLEHWKPGVKKDIDWESVMRAEGDKVGTAVGGPLVPHPEDSTEEPQFFTIGLIGQPNVGKSSLLNAIFGANKVSASKTPGRTKHFQTLFWTSEVRLVDCPGLVMPNLVPLEMQVLTGILPISRLSAVPFCTHFAATLLPLETILKLVQPGAPVVVDKRTWRAGERPASLDPKNRPWTAMDVLVAYAEAKGWMTAQGGRPDVHRAGNASVFARRRGRAYSVGVLASKRGTKAQDDGTGIWIKSEGDLSSDEKESEDEDSADEKDKSSGSGADGPAESDDDDDSEDQDEVDGPPTKVAGAGRFGALLEVEEDSSEAD
ncbi:G domain-containing protein [Mycena kentingensis (nom. inval.)]|nr:G domain-containing protein [Mycena kentingensis (nom. inval.)]